MSFDQEGMQRWLNREEVFRRLAGEAGEPYVESVLIKLAEQARKMAYTWGDNTK